MPKKDLWKFEAGDGNYMGARAFVDAAIQVSALFQITPTTQFAEWLTEFKRRGLLPMTELLLMNGEDDAFTACHSASQCGVRVGTGSCSQGLLFGAQPLKSLAGSRCPVVTLAAMRSTSAPINIHCSHDDVQFFRDTGNIILIAKDPSEVYTCALLAFKIGEDPRVQLPVIVGYDGFDVSHTIKTDNRVLSEEGLALFRDYLGEYDRPNSALSLEHSVSMGSLVLPQYFMEVNYAELMAMENALVAGEDAVKYFSKNFWKIPPLVTGYRTADAEYIVIGMGSTWGTMKEAVDVARDKGIKAGAVSVMMYRPFPVAKLRKILGKAKAIATLDRAPTFGAPCGPFGADVAGMFVNQAKKPLIMNCIYGLGGRLLSVQDLVTDVIEPLKTPKTWQNDTRSVWIGVRGGK